MSILSFTACKKDVIEYKAELIDEKTTAQFQIYYLVPLATGAANAINKIELDGKLIANNTTPLNTFNLLPSAAVSRFFTTKPGKVNLKLYRGPVASLALAYDQEFDIPAGRYNVVIHDFSKPPILIHHETPYPTVTTEFSGTTAWIKFSNFMYESPGVPTPLKIQYQFQYTVDNATAQKSDWLDLGKPVSFGESTGWEPVTVNKTVEISAGTARIDYRIRIIGADGTDQGTLMVRNAAGATVAFADWWNAAVGRVYHHNLAGYRVGSTITTAIRQFTAL